MKTSLNIKETLYELHNLRDVHHTTLNPYGPGSVRIHLVPPKISLGKKTPFLVFLNGTDILPIKPSWAILLASFIEEVNFYEGKEITEDDLKKIILKTVRKVKRVYSKVSSQVLINDLHRMINSFTAIAYGKDPGEDIGIMSIGEYAEFMNAPHRMDLMISSMSKNAHWNCNQKCLHCYAANQEYANTPELTTSQWKKIIDSCRKIGIPQITFTGGEPTMRKDLVELISHSKWFVTRLNTNGVLLTQELCEDLFEAELDSVQVTLYSYDEDIHNSLVGVNNYNLTIAGIKNAVSAGLNVSINTPLCNLNSDYAKTLEFIHSLGVKYVSCSGLIPTGNATTKNSIATQLSSAEMYSLLEDATLKAKELHIEMSFTSPGWVDNELLTGLDLSVPACGACLSNMAITPDGNVVPCQSWLTSGYSLGNILEDDWKNIWNSDMCLKIRNNSAKMENFCQLKNLKEDN